MSGTSGESTVLTALTLEARRRGTTYGKLVAALSEKEIDRIVRVYRTKQEARRRAELSPGGGSGAERTLRGRGPRSKKAEVGPVRPDLENNRKL